VPPLTVTSRKILDPIVPAWDHVDNPVDLWSTIEKAGSKKAYNVATRALLAGDDLDALIIINLAMPESEMDWDELARLKNSRPEIPLILCLLGGWPKMRAECVTEAFKRDIPVFYTPDDALGLLAKVLL
jgi:acyl-CoA synthetase (NDP forming)